MAKIAMRRGLRTGTRSRLLGVVAIPLIAMITLVAFQLQVRHDMAHDANRIVREMDRSNAILDAYGALIDEQRMTAMAVAAGHLGVTTEQIGPLFDIDFAAQLANSRRRVSADPYLASVLVRTGLGAVLDSTRQQVDAGTAPSSAVEALYASLSTAVHEEWMNQILSAQETSTAVTGTAELARVMTSLTYTADVFSAGNAQTRAMANLLLPSLPGADTALVDLVASTTRYKIAEGRLLRSLSPTAQSRWISSISANPNAQRFEAQIDLDLIGRSDPLPFGNAIELVRFGLDRQDALLSMAQHVADSATSDARSLEHRSTDAFRHLAFALILVAGLTLTLALFTVRSITVPARRLHHRAIEVTTGRLSPEDLDEMGPRELAQAARAMNEMVASLRSVESQAIALAAGDLARAQSLDAAPGELGRVVHEAIDGLRTSIAHQNELRSKLAYEASHDTLTGLMNRRALVEHLDSLIAAPAGATAPTRPGEASKPAHRPGAVVFFLDLDGFKQINDRAGHAAGDQVLQDVAARLAQVVPATSVVARLGGDEFVVVFPGSMAMDNAVATAQRLIDAVGDHVMIRGERRELGTSVGIAFAQDSDRPDEVLRDADLALYRAKQGGRGRAVVFDAAMRAELASLDAMATRLRDAVKGDELDVFYQPIVVAVTGEMSGVEALVRWPQPDGGFVPPGVFIPVAERSELVTEIDRWVMRRATAQVAHWRDHGFAGLTASVNVSVANLRAPGFIADLRCCLADSRLDPGALIVEVTETMLLDDLSSAAEQLAIIREMGVRVAVDDFGTGFTSVAHLRNLPVDRLKIDRSFIANLSSSRDRSITEMVVRLGQAIDLEVVAEGVEEPWQLAHLVELGCHYSQGYLHGRPRDAAAFEATFAPGVRPMAAG